MGRFDVKNDVILTAVKIAGGRRDGLRPREIASEGRKKSLIRGPIKCEISQVDKKINSCTQKETATEKADKSALLWPVFLGITAHGFN